MKTYIAILALVLFPLSSRSQGFVVNKLSVNVHLSQEDYFDVEEVYDIEFYEQKHGIIRDIGTEYDYIDEHGATKFRKIAINKIRVGGWNYSINKFKDKISIRIGDPNKLIVGPKQYTIKYRVKNSY